MSKKIHFVFASLVLAFSFPVQALEATGSEQPYQESRLRELMDNGQNVSPEVEHSLTFKHRAGSNAPSSFDFNEETERPCQDINCGLTLKKSVFAITKKNSAGCGSVRYEARDIQMPWRVVEVVDHSNRRCDDLQPYQWELTLKEPGKAPRRLVAESDDISVLH